MQWLGRKSALIRGLEKAGVTYQPSRGPRRVWGCYVTPAFSGVPNTKNGDKISSGYLTPAFSGAKKRAELLRKPCLLGGLKERGVAT